MKSRTIFNGPVVQSDGERIVAEVLAALGIAFRYDNRFLIIKGYAIRPDFYLPEFDLYVELTTLKQSLVRKKNRKLRRLRELYPDVRIKLFYARDFKALLLKYGRFDPPHR